MVRAISKVWINQMVYKLLLIVCQQRWNTLISHSTDLDLCEAIIELPFELWQTIFYFIELSGLFCISSILLNCWWKKRVELSVGLRCTIVHINLIITSCGGPLRGRCIGGPSLPAGSLTQAIFLVSMWSATSPTFWATRVSYEGNIIVGDLRTFTWDFDHFLYCGCAERAIFLLLIWNVTWSFFSAHQISYKAAKFWRFKNI